MIFVLIYCLKKITARILFTFMILLFAKSHAATLQYTIYKDKEVIGNIVVKRDFSKQKTTYDFESRVYIKLLFQFNIFDKMKVVCENNVLQQASLYRTVNGKIKVNNNIKLERDQYILSNKNQQVKNLSTPIYHTTATMYFNEPLAYNYVYSENFQRMIKINKSKQNTYSLQLPNGNKTTYTYKNGICHEVLAETDWASVRFVLRTI